MENILGFVWMSGGVGVFSPFERTRVICFQKLVVSPFSISQAIVALLLPFSVALVAVVVVEKHV